MHRIAYHREHATMRVIILIAGSILLLLGVISMVTPIPGGTLAIAVGGGMIICTSETAKRYIRICRTRYQRFNSIMTWLENRLGERLSAPLRTTRPDSSQQ